MSPAVIDTLVGAIPAEDGASFVAQVGEPGRITSRAGTVAFGSAPLTVAAIDDLNAKIFPPAQLEALKNTGLAQFDFALPGVDGTFTALAGSAPGDRWLDIRRRSTTKPAKAPQAAWTTAAPQPAPTPAPAAGGFDDLGDLASLDFPAKTIEPARVQSASRTTAAPQAAAPTDRFNDLSDLASLEFPARDASDLDALTVSEEIFDKPAMRADSRGKESADLFAWDGAHAQTALDHEPPARSRVRKLIPIAGGVAVLLAAGYFGATRYLSGDATAASPSVPAARTAPPPARVSTPPPAQPPATPQASPAPAPAQQTAASAKPAATPPVQTAVTPPPQTAATAPAQGAATPKQTAPAPTAAAPPAQKAAAPPPQTATTSAAATPRGSAAPPQTAAPQQTPSAAKPQPTPPAQAATKTVPPAQAVGYDAVLRSGYAVQVAAVDSREEADRLVARFVTRGYPAYFVRGEGAAANFYRVRIGTYVDRAKAEEVAKQLAGTDGIKPWIAKEVPDKPK